MFTKAKLIDAAKVMAIAVVAVAVAESLGVMARVRALTGRLVPAGVTSAPAGEAPEPYVLEGF